MARCVRVTFFRLDSRCRLFTQFCVLWLNWMNCTSDVDPQTTSTTHPILCHLVPTPPALNTTASWHPLASSFSSLCHTPYICPVCSDCHLTAQIHYRQVGYEIPLPLLACWARLIGEAPFHHLSVPSIVHPWGSLSTRPSRFLFLLDLFSHCAHSGRQRQRPDLPKRRP